MAGYEELQDHLRNVAAAYARHPDLQKLTFLVRRAQADFQTSLEAALSGYHNVAYDSMRDVMEIEFLIRDFRFEPNRIDQWLTGSDKERNDNFRPAVLRQRHANRVGAAPQDMGEATDYKGHSMFLHVSPHTNPFGGPGLVSDEGFSFDSCFWEIYEHGRRLVWELYFLRRKLAPRLRGAGPGPKSLRKLKDGWQRTRQMQTVFFAMVQVMKEEETRDGAA